MSAPDPQCTEKVFSNWSHHRCSRKAIKDGFCKQHHPDRTKERVARWKAEAEERRRQWQTEKEHRVEMQRRYDCHDALVAALEAAIAHYDRLGVTQPWMPQARAALAAAATQPAGR